MPKTSILVSSSESAQADNRRVFVYHCVCSETVLALDVDLQRLPVRTTDASPIVDRRQRFVKWMNVQTLDTRLLQRYAAF